MRIVAILAGLLLPSAALAQSSVSIPTLAQQVATYNNNSAAFRTNNLSDLTNAATARVNLGLGTMATQGANGAVLNLSSANPTPPLNVFNSITGTWPGGNPILNKIEVTADTARGDAWNDAVGALELNYSWGGTVGSPAGSGGRYALRAYTSTGTLVNKGAGGVSWPYIVTAEFKGTVFGNAGGNSLVDPWGSQYVLNPVATLAPGATFLAMNTTGEFDIASYYGSSTVNESMLTFTQLAQEWGSVGYGDGRTGRSLLKFSAAAPAGDSTSSASALATYGQQLPSQDYGFQIDTALMGSATRLFSFLSPVNQNTNSCASCGAGSSGSPPTGGAAIAAPMRKPPALGYGLDLRQFNMTNQPFASTGFQVQPTGETDIGVAKLVPTDTTIGLTIDVTGQYVSAVAAYGTWGPKQVGEQVYDNFGGGGIYQVASTDNSVSSAPSIGNVTGWSIVYPSHVSGTPPCSSPCTVFGSGAPAYISLTWSAPTALNLNPTGGNVIMPYFTDTIGGGPRFTANPQCVGCDFVALTNGHGLFLTDQNGVNYHAFGTNSTSVFMQYTDNLGVVRNAFSMPTGGALSAAALTMNVPLVLGAAERSATGTAPTISSCGGGVPSVVGGSDLNRGSFTTGTGSPTSCLITWPASSRPTPPLCVLTTFSGAAFAFTSSTTAAALTVGFSAGYSGQVTYICRE